MNIGGDAKDPFYRYKMSPLEIVQVKGKTIIDNLKIISRELNRPEIYIIKYISYSLGCSSTYTSATSKWSISGYHDKIKLQEIIIKFIQQYIICDECGNPETELTINKKILMKSCKSCSETSFNIPETPLTRYIIKNFGKH
jgi:translation initiation factor 5